MGRDHADGRGLLLFNQCQGSFRIKFFQHDRFGADQGGGEVGERAGGTAGMGCNRHGGVFVGEIPDVYAAF